MPAYKDGDGRWRYRFSYNGERYSGSTPKAHNTKKAAEKIEREQLERLIARQYLGKMPTIEEFAERFLEHQKPRVKPLTFVQQNATIRQHVIPAWRKDRLDAVSKEMIDTLVSLWANGTKAVKPSKPKTINTRLGTVRRMFSLAVDWRIISRVPEIEFVRVSESTPRWLTDAEAFALYEAVEEHWKAMIMVALRTGLRIGELRGLQWNDVDLVRRVIQVRRTDPGRRTIDATSPKGKRERTVPLSNDAVVALESVRPDKPNGSAFVWPALLKRGGEIRSRCRSEKGCWHAIDRAAKKVGLSDVGWHTLRHTYASHLVMRGVPIRTIQKWLGHASVKETEKYSHLAPDYGYDAANLLDTALTPDRLRQPATKHLPEGARERNDNVELPSEG